MPIDVVILGGGAAGALAAVHLLQQSAGKARIAIVEPRERLAQGVAYSTPRPEHRLNVIAARMSAFENDAAHFVRYRRNEKQDDGLAPIELQFAQRRDYGEYLRRILSCHGPSRPEHIRDEAIGITGSGPYTVQLASGGALRCRAVVLAVGNVARPLPLPPEALIGEPRIDAVWDHAAVSGIDADADVAILGAGLSMIDAVLTLAAHGHRGRIDVISRHGLMPHGHAVPGPHGAVPADLLGLPLRARMRAIRRQAAAAMAAGEPWQWTMDRLRPYGETLWRSLGDADQRRFLRHVARYWDVHRHRIAPDVAERVQSLRRSGRLRIHAGHLVDVCRDDRGTTVRYVPRGATDPVALAVDRVLNSTGLELRLARSPIRLLQALSKRQRIVAGPHGIGVATTAAGVIVAKEGRTQPDMLVIGALRIGSAWESIAIPELRVQAQTIAQHLVARLRLGPAPVHEAPAAQAPAAIVQQRTLQIVAAVIRDTDGRVLLVRKRGSDVFIQPGGKREFDEDSLTTLARELREEIGVDVVPGSAVRLGEFEDDAVNEPGLRVRAEVFLVDIVGAPVPLAEIEALAWVVPGGPHAVRIAPLTRTHILPRLA